MLNRHERSKKGENRLIRVVKSPSCVSIIVNVDEIHVENEAE